MIAPSLVIPAPSIVIPAKLNRHVMSPGHDCGVRGTPHLFNGIQTVSERGASGRWIPAFAGMTGYGDFQCAC